MRTSKSSPSFAAFHGAAPLRLYHVDPSERVRGCPRFVVPPAGVEPARAFQRTGI